MRSVLLLLLLGGCDVLLLLLVVLLGVRSLLGASVQQSREW
jgi:hypothetical protein